MWTNEDAALTNVAKGIRKGVNGLNGSEDPESAEAIEARKNNATGGRVGRREMARTPQTIDRNYLKKIVKQYYIELKDYQEVANYELGLRAAFQNMLSAIAKYCGWSLAPEMTIDKIRPDGVILDEFPHTSWLLGSQGTQGQFRRRDQEKDRRWLPTDQHSF